MRPIQSRRRRRPVILPVPGGGSVYRVCWPGYGVESRENTVPKCSALIVLDANESWIGGMPYVGGIKHLIVRFYFKGSAPYRERIANRMRYWMQLAQERGFQVSFQIGNEPNHPDENWTLGVTGYVELYRDLHGRVPEARLLWVPPSPGFDGWTRWLEPVEQLSRDGVCVGASLHAYGDLQTIKDVLWTAKQALPSGIELHLTEFNFGPSKELWPQSGDQMKDAWARATITVDFWHWLQEQGFVTALYYQLSEKNPHYEVATRVDAAGTVITTLVQEWSEFAEREAARPDPEPDPGPAGDPVSSGDEMRGPPGVQDPPEEPGEDDAVPQGGEPEGHAAAESTLMDQSGPDRDEAVNYAITAAIREGIPFKAFVNQIDQESGFQHTKDDGTLIGSPAGAQGIAQIVPRFHPDANVQDWKASLDYAAKWMGSLLRMYGSLVKALIHYNGGHGAVAAWAAGTPYRESANYIDGVLGSWTQPQFEPDGSPSRWLLAGGASVSDILGMCGPLAMAGAACALGIALDPVHALAIAKATYLEDGKPAFVGETRGPAAFEAYVRSSGLLDLVRVLPQDIPENLNACLPVVISTPKHYYLVQRASLLPMDPELCVGNSGLARTGGDRWMSLDQITKLDGWINGIWRLQRPQATVEPPKPAKSDPVDARLALCQSIESAVEALRLADPGPIAETFSIAAKHALYLYKFAAKVGT